MRSLDKNCFEDSKPLLAPPSLSQLRSLALSLCSRLIGPLQLLDGKDIYLEAEKDGSYAGYARHESLQQKSSSCRKRKL